MTIERRTLAMLGMLGSVNCADDTYLIRNYGIDAVDYAIELNWIEPSEHNCSDWFTYETTETGQAMVWRIANRLNVRPRQIEKIVIAA